jgi:hypothetical protein
MAFDLIQALQTLVEKYNQSKSDYENFMNLKGNDLNLPENIAMPLARNYGIDMINEPWEISTHYREQDYDNYNQHVKTYVKTFNEYRDVFITYRRFTFWIKTFMSIKNYLDNQQENRLHSDYFVFNKNNNFASLYKMLEDVEQPIDQHNVQEFNQHVVNVADLMDHVRMQQVHGENIYKLIIDNIKELDINWDIYNFNIVQFDNSYERIMRLI